MRNQKSFTLIELLVVIVIIGILAGVIMVSTSSAITKANFAKAQHFSGNIQNELLSNLVSEWTFNNETNLGEDTWGNNDGTLFGEIASELKENCVYGTCLHFDEDDYINCGNNSVLNFGTGDFTITSWIKTSAIVLQHIAGKRESAINWYRVYIDGSGLVRLELAENYPTNSVVSLVASGAVNNNSWHYIVAFRKGTSLGIYIDSEKKGIGSSSYNVDNTANFLIGRFNTTGSNQFDGLMDDIRVYDLALSLSQIKKEYILGLNSLLANNNISKEEYQEKIESLGLK